MLNLIKTLTLLLLYGLMEFVSSRMILFYPSLTESAEGFPSANFF